MGWRALRNIAKPLSRSIFTQITNPTPTTLRASYTTPVLLSSLHHSIQSSSITSLTDTRFPKRRPGFENRRKRSTLKPPGPYAWVKYTPGEPILANRPNQGSVKRRNERKRIGQHKAFIKLPDAFSVPAASNIDESIWPSQEDDLYDYMLATQFIQIEAKKRKVQLQAAKKKKIEKRIERKMAAVARERAWIERLAELQQLEAEKKAATNA